MYSFKENLNFLIYLMSMSRKKNPQNILILSFVYYLLICLRKLPRLRLCIFLNDEIFLPETVRDCRKRKNFVDVNSCVYGNCHFENAKSEIWCYICSLTSSRKYKVFLINSKDIPEDKLYISNEMIFNLQNTLGISDLDTSYFIFPAVSNNIMYATKATISLISNPYESSYHIMDDLLKNYFSKPRFLHSQDVFSVNIRLFSPDFYYSAMHPEFTGVYFKVKDIENKGIKGNCDGFYILYGETTLVQESNIHSYLPGTGFSLESNNLSIVNDGHSQCPPSLEDGLSQLQECITPFLFRADFSPEIKPAFLIKGPQGSGKFKLIKIASKQLGLHLLNVDFNELQSLTAAQIEAKMRIFINNAENSVPCILILGNIQGFGMNNEGEKDDRIIDAIKMEFERLFKKNLKFPVIIVATTENSDFPADLGRLFVETIEIKYPNQSQKAKLLSWLLKNNGIEYEADLYKIAGLCSDFVLADLEALIFHAIKTKYKDIIQDCSSIFLSYNDFSKACAYIQSLSSNRFEAPTSTKVHWEDIGGLANLKHEIIKRIELPLLNQTGLGRAGLLLYGPPGTGKTLLAKAVATECQLNFMSVKGPELLNMYVGQSEKNVRQVFERARAAAPCIIFFDELDSLAPNRGQSGDSGGVMDRVVSQLLSEMDGLEYTENISIIGATNRPDLIDPALLRPGRFDKMLYVGIYSDEESQLDVLRALTRRFKLENEGRELERVIKELKPNLTGADLYSICSNAWLSAVRKFLEDVGNTDNTKIDFNSRESSLIKKEVVVRLEDFVKAAQDLIPSVSIEELKRYEKLHKELSVK